MHLYHKNLITTVINNKKCSETIKFLNILDKKIYGEGGIRTRVSCLKWFSRTPRLAEDKGR